MEMGEKKRYVVKNGTVTNIPSARKSKGRGSVKSVSEDDVATNVAGGGRFSKKKNWGLTIKHLAARSRSYKDRGIYVTAWHAISNPDKNLRFPTVQEKLPTGDRGRKKKGNMTRRTTLGRCSQGRKSQERKGKGAKEKEAVIH